MKLIRLILMSSALTVGVAAFAVAQQGPSDEQTQQKMMGGGQAPMMGGAMTPKMGMMRQGGMMPMMMPMMGMADHIEGRLSFLKTELKIADAQLPQWNAFADVARASAVQMNDMMKQGTAMMQGGTAPSLPQRLDFREKQMAAHLEMLRKMKAALLPLYATFTEEQKQSADALFHGPMGI